MATAQDHIDWIRRTLDELPSSHGVLLPVRRAIASGGMCMGAILPAEHLPEIAAALLPELDARIAALGPISERAPQAHRWPERSRAEEGVLRGLLERPPLESAPYPYVRSAQHAIGGLRSAGFADGTELLLVVSSQGMGVFDCATFERVGRDRREAKFVGDSVVGIPPIGRGRVQQMGIETDFALPRRTPDGWSLGILSPEYDASIWLCPPGMDTERPTLGSVRFAQTFEEVRVAGFSTSGDSLIIGEQHTLHIFHRRGPASGTSTSHLL